MKKMTVVDRLNSANTKVTEWKRDALGVVRKEIDPKGYGGIGGQPPLSNFSGSAQQRGTRKLILANVPLGNSEEPES